MKQILRLMFLFDIVLLDFLHLKLYRGLIYYIRLHIIACCYFNWADQRPTKKRVDTTCLFLSGLVKTPKCIPIYIYIYRARDPRNNKFTVRKHVGYCWLTLLIHNSRKLLGVLKNSLHALATHHQRSDSCDGNWCVQFYWLSFERRVCYGVRWRQSN